MSPAGGHLGFQSVQKVTKLGKQLAMIIHDNFQFHPPCSIGEEDLWNFSQLEAIMAPAAILDNRLEQKVTTIDQDLVRNISAKSGSIPSSGYWEEVFFHISHKVAMWNYVPRWRHLGFSIGPKSNNTWLAACNDHSWQFSIPSSM
jgi:hypothetical protein